MNKNKFHIILFVCVLLFVMFSSFYKCNMNIYVESLESNFRGKIDLKISIDNDLVFNDTLKQNLGGYPIHITSPLCIGYHTISVSSNLANIYKEEKLFLLFNNYILIYFLCNQRNSDLEFVIEKGSGSFGFE